MKKAFDFIVFVFLVAAFFASVAAWQRSRTVAYWKWVKVHAKEFRKGVTLP